MVRGLKMDRKIREVTALFQDDYLSAISISGVDDGIWTHDPWNHNPVL